MSRRTQLALHAAALLFVLIGAAAATGAGTGVSSDEGAGAYQAVLLGRGRWTLPPTLPELDPTKARQPFFRSEVGRRGWAPYGKHPLYPAMLGLARGVRPVGGLVAVSVLGAWIAAIVAARLAELIRAGRGVVALWLVGALSPLTVDSSWVLAHAPAAAAGVMTVHAADGASRREPSDGGRLVSWLALSALGAGVTGALRTEGTILVGALAVGLLARARPDRRGLATVAALLVGGLAGRFIEVAVSRSTLGGGVVVPATPGSNGSFLAGRLEAFQASWLDPGRSSGAFLLAAAGLVVLAALLHRRRFPAPLVATVAVTAVAAALTWLVRGPDLVPGLLPATAWLVPAAVVVGQRAFSPGLPRLLAVTTLIAAAGILSVQYSFGGGVEWGGRFYVILVPAAGALVAATWPEEFGATARWLVSALVLVAAFTSLGGVYAVRQEHERTDALERDILAAVGAAPPGRAGDPDDRPVVLTNHPLWPQLIWQSFESVRWIAAEPPLATCALADLRRAGFQRVVLADRPLAPLVDEALGLGWQEDSAFSRSRFVTVLVASPGGPVGAGCAAP